MSRLITLLVLLFLFSCQTEKEENNVLKVDKSVLSEKVDTYAKAYESLDIFSGAILIAKDGKPVYERAFGLANRDDKRPNTLQTKYLIGSMNKDFTRVLILQLIAEGKLRWTDKMIDYLNGFDQPGVREVTVRQLADHTSGFGDYEDWDFVELPYAQKNLATILERARNQELLFEPGTDNEYSNTGYALLGAIIERITRKTYEQNVKERIAQPLGMNNTYLKDIQQKPDRTIGYIITINGVDNTEMVIAEPRPDGGFWCTPSDLLLFYQNFFYGSTLIPDSIRATDTYFKQIAPLYSKPNSIDYLAGGTNGHNSVIGQFFKENISIIVLANMDEPVAEKVVDGIVAILNAREPQAPKLPALLAAYQAYKENGVGYLKSNFEEVTSNYNPGDPKDGILNNLGYQLIEAGKMDEAVDLLKLNTELFPDIANCWDSYGEVLLKKGDKKGALKAYQRALSIQPMQPNHQ